MKNMVKLIHTLADHDDDVNCCAFSSSLLATCSLDKPIRLYSLSDFSELPHSPLKSHTYAVHCCCFSASGHILASCSTDGTTVLWDTQNGQTLAVLEQPSGSPVRVCRFSPDSTCLVSGAADGTVVLWNAQSYKLYRCASVKDGSLVACAFSPNGNFFVTGSSCGDLTVWDDKMRCLHSEKAHNLGITCCDFSSQPVSGGEQGLQFFRLASCGQDCQIKIWVISFTHTLGFELKYKSILSGHCAPVLTCAFSHDGQMLVSGSVDKSVIVYDTDAQEYNIYIFRSAKTVMQNTEDILHTLTQHTRYVTTCAFAPNILLLATGSMDKTVNIWQFDLETPCQESLGLRSKVLRKIEELRTKMKTLSSEIPDEFICPITRELMKDPVIASDGYSYEKEAMENWISKKKRTSPMTNLVLPSVVLIPNRTLKMAIDRWLETHQK
ncbi:WD repeat, SAM and U-box domain-containing protein 1 isoform X4 [Neophocaena asiaeorientalis asiaeorientalis]|uniref:WD repeat, SAM and U-box domain-containing protein 1 isoform X4 n=1 Tax=Neophocaena asiaeorientalis asiaeorientalis TaxID=1706337 RepID=A0A341ALQ4_NEOAA|nr:WD repeat, SAM and U-box domain-containing protein 1 isoform X4 [Neophocaena asiaeorientalis asiaeorientalis]